MDIIPDKILPCNHDDSSSNGNGYGSGRGNGKGYGNGSGYGNGHGNGHGWGEGDGHGDGWGDGHGGGQGGGIGHGDGDGGGLGDGNGSGLGLGHRIFISHDRPIEAYWVFGDESHPHLGQRLDPKPGDVQEWPYRVELCYRGLHASMSLNDALEYRDGIAFRVLCSGWCQFQLDKLVCSRRVIVEEV